MPPEDIRAASRRRFLQYCAASPLLASGAIAARAMEAPSKLPDPMMWAPPGSADLIKTPKEAINVFDFEPVARQNVPPAHFGYMASAASAPDASKGDAAQYCKKRRRLAARIFSRGM